MSVGATSAMQQSVLCLMITGLIYTLTGTAEAESVLLTSSVEQDGRQLACPGEVITFTCTIAKAAGIRWTAEPFITQTNPIIFTITNENNDVQDRGVFHAVLKTVTMPDYFFFANFTSTLTVRASESLNDTVVQCTVPHEGGEISNRSIFIATLPPPPQQLNYSIQEYGRNTFTATVFWENLTDERVGRSNITVTVSDFEPILLLPDSTTAVALTLSYNEVHTVSIAATNCAGTSNTSQLKIYEVGCGDPMPPRSGTLECYNSTEEGSKVFYRCNAGLTPQEQMISVCASNGSWAPDPIELQCSQLPPVQCELPSTLSGEVLNYTSITEGSLVIHHCEQGLLPTEPTIAVCTADGVWDPDLDQVKCMAPGQPPVQCELPSTLSGEVLNYTSITEGSLVIHHCEQGLLPTEPTIAVCTADGVWDPDLDQVKCMAPGQPPETHDPKPTETSTRAHGLNPGAIIVITAATSGLTCLVVGGIMGALLHHGYTRKKSVGRQEYTYHKLQQSERKTEK